MSGDRRRNKRSEHLASPRKTISGAWNALDQGKMTALYYVSSSTQNLEDTTYESVLLSQTQQVNFYLESPTHIRTSGTCEYPQAHAGAVNLRFQKLKFLSL